MDHPDLADDARYADGPSRWRNQVELDGIISAWTRDKDDVELMERLQQVGVPAGSALEAGDIARLPQLEARRLYHEFDDYEGNHLRYPGLPWRFVGGPEERVLPAVGIGHHNDYVLCELLGLSPYEVEALVGEQVVY
jgi:crotonobetainyl-CoA:carnitine CoA-transferase CaiB-like acyl-CoA transferase